MNGILVFVTVFWRLSLGLELKVSKESQNWASSTAMHKGLLSREYIKNNGWDSLRTHLTGNDSYWIGARGEYTRFVSWEGCIQRPTCRSKNCQLTKFEDSGSISKCLDNCRSHYFALQGNECFCLSEAQRIYCVNNSSKECEDTCFENPNDFCGGSNDVMTLYHSANEDVMTNQTLKDSGGNCVILFKNKTLTYYQQHYCLKMTRRYICRGENGMYDDDTGSNVTWKQAYNLCRHNAGNMYYTTISTYDLDVNLWTSLRRSFGLIWTTDTGGPRRCVAIRMGTTSTLILTLENCMKELRFIYVSELTKQGDTKGETSNEVSTITIAIFVTMSAAIFVTLLGLLIHHIHRSTCCVGETRANEEIAENENVAALNAFEMSEHEYHTTVKSPVAVNSHYERVPRDDLLTNGGYDVANYKKTLKSNAQCSEYGYGVTTREMNPDQTSDALSSTTFNP